MKELTTATRQLPTSSSFLLHWTDPAITPDDALRCSRDELASVGRPSMAVDGTALSVGSCYYFVLTGAITFQFSGVPVEGSTIEIRRMVAESAATITFPSSIRVGTSQTSAQAQAVTFQPGTHKVMFEYISNGWVMTDTGDD